MEFTGERMIPESNVGSKIYLEHVNRYYFATQFVKDKDVLDIACGSGYGTDILGKGGAKTVFGVDISEEAILFCKEKYPSINFSVGSVEKIPADDKSKDVVVSFETIEHVDEELQEKFMKEVSRVLKDDGILVLSTPNALVYEKGNEFHVKELNPKELDVLLKKHGFAYQIFFQESVDSNFILSSTEIENGSIGGRNMAIFENGEKRAPWEARYLVVVCTRNNNNPEISSSIYVSNIKSPRNAGNIEEIVAGKNREIELKDAEIASRDAENELMKSSKFWKLRDSYIRLKKFLFLK